MLDNTAASAIQSGLLSALSKQAAQLEAFFGDSAGSTFFTQMADAQGAIKGQVANTTPAAYLDLVNGHAVSVAETLFTTAEAQTLWTGYRAGHYLLTRDWQTVEDYVVDQTKLDEYKAAYRAINDTDPYGIYGGHTTTIPMGMAPNSALVDIEDALVTAGVAELSAQGVTGTKAQDMVRALVRQFGQDNVEFQAFYDDLSHEEMPAATRTYNADVGQATAMAPIGQQSAKLASVDAEFPHDAIKYNYKTNTIFMNNRKDGSRTV